jgi:DNA-binding NtrC family response regulator
MSEKTKVLIVDDEEIVCLSFLRSLTGAHCSVEIAWNGAEALLAMEQHRFDLVLLDLRMPGMDGMTVLKTIKQKWPETQVVVITGYPNVETAKEAVRLGAYGYLAKPVGPDEIIHAANDAVMQKKWTLQRERAGQDMGTASSTGALGKTRSLAC